MLVLHIRTEATMPHKLILSLLALSFALPAAAAELDDLDALGWLAGCWEGRGGGGRNQECWMPPAGGMMLGLSRVISERGTSFEFLRIAAHGEGLAYLASPRGKEPVAFQLVESSDGRAVFTNPFHDFPQRLTYRRDGDSMTARVEAQREGEWRGFDVAWKRVGDGWPGEPAPSDAEAPSPPSPDGPDAARKDLLVQQVRDVEAAFAKTMADRDHDAFSALLSDEAVFVSRATARGSEQVAAQWQRFFDGPAAPFSWQPETVEVLDSGTLALSTGPVHDPDGQLISRFTSIWRQEAPGEWRIVFDKGNKACEE